MCIKTCIIALWNARKIRYYGRSCVKLGTLKILRSNWCKPRLSWMILVDLFEARVISIRELAPPVLSLPRFDLVVLLYFILPYLAFRDGRKRAHVLPRYPPATIVSIAGFPEIIRKSLPRSFLRVLFRRYDNRCDRPTSTSLPAYVRLQTQIHLCMRLFVGQRFHPRGYPLFLAVFSSQRALIYSEHKRCSQITVPFMTLLLHRRTRSFLR